MKTVTVKISGDDIDADKAARRLVTADRVYQALVEIKDTVFRPARKHGYSNQLIQDLCTRLGDGALDLIGMLESEFFGVLQEYGVDLEDSN